MNESALKDILFCWENKKLDDFLTNNVVDINWTNNYQKTALFNCDTEKAKILIKHGINTEICDKHGYTALFYCAEKEKFNLLLSKMKDVNMKNGQIIKYIKTIEDYNIIHEKGYDMGTFKEDASLRENTRNNVRIYNRICAIQNAELLKYVILLENIKTPVFLQNRPFIVEWLIREEVENVKEKEKIAQILFAQNGEKYLELLENNELYYDYQSIEEDFLLKVCHEFRAEKEKDKLNSIINVKTNNKSIITRF